MVQNSLVRYIQEQIRAGYDIGTIKAYLIRYGYPETQINEAIQFAYPPTEVKHVLHLSKVTIALIAAVVCSLVIGSLAVFFLVGEKGAQLLDVKTEVASPSIKQGDNLYFTVELTNLGKAKQYDVNLRYEIRGSENSLVTFKEETVAVETKKTNSVNIDLGDASPGSYYIKTIASYKGGSAKASSQFNVAAKTSTIPTPVTPKPTLVPTKRCPFSCDDSNECTNDYCNEVTGYECRHDKKYPCCGNGICEDNEDYNSCLADCKAPADKVDSIFEGKTIWERIDIIKQISKSDKSKALEYCKEIEQTTYKYECFTGVGVATQDKSLCTNIEDDISRDACYRSVAVEAKNSGICADISKESKRDQCYMDFATKGDYTVCDKLVNKYLKQSCESLQQLSTMQVPSS